MKIHVLIPPGKIREQFLTPENAAYLNCIGDVSWKEDEGQYSEREMEEIIRRSDVLVTGWGCPCVKAPWLDGRPKLMAHMGGTVASYIEPEVFGAGLSVVSGNEIFAMSVAEGTLAYMLCGLRQIPKWDRVLKSGGWRGDEIKNKGLWGKRIGLTGYGAITRHLLPLLRPFDGKVLLCSDHVSQEECQELGVQKAELREIFSTCDIISIHNGLTEKTRGMIDEGLLSLIREGSLLVNTARGGLIDEAALEKGLKEGRFYGVLDVFRQEPLPQDSCLRQCENVIIMPHMAGPTGDIYPYAGRAVIEEIERFAAGQPLRYRIDPALVKYMTIRS